MQISRKMIRSILTIMIFYSNIDWLNSSSHEISEDPSSDISESEDVTELQKNFQKYNDGMENTQNYDTGLDSIPSQDNFIPHTAAEDVPHLMVKEEDSNPVFSEKHPNEHEKYMEGGGEEQSGKSDQVDGREHESSEAVPNKDNEEIKSNPERENDVKRQRIFPLLYTFGTLFNSFLAEFGEVTGSQDIGYNSSDKDSKNSSVSGEILNDTNALLNGSDSGKKTRFQCALRNVTENTIFEVKIVNSSELLEILNFSKNQKLSPCVLVMFYAPWCYFCASTAPYYNALARAFPQLNILAVDTSHFSYLNARFGTVAVPNVMLFHSRSAVRFNHTTRDLDHFIQFVTNNTGLEPNSSVKVETWDFEGPLSSQVVQKQDWLLWLAWTFVVICTTYGFIRSLYGQAFIARVRVLWQEHQHIE